LNDDPAASPTLVAGFGVITAAFATLAVRLARSAVSRARPRDVIPVAFLRGLE
jgi:hypothetical protein